MSTSHPRDKLGKKGGDIMSNVIKFPRNGEKIALYTETKIYAGTCSEGQDFFGRTGIWLTDAVVYPIAGHIHPDDVLHLGSVCVLWEKVVAVSYAPDFEPAAFPE